MSFVGKPKSIMPIAQAIDSDPTAAQIAGLCWRPSGRTYEVLLVTSRDTGRWIIPKGWTMKNLAPAEAALREAFEEAGVEGVAHAEAVGGYPYVKIMPKDMGIPCMVAVFAIRVKRLLDRFPEKGQRRRKWFSLEKAAQKVDEPDLRELLRSFVPPADKTS